MVRALRLQFGGAIYHITSRANERRAIFRSDSDREDFLEVVSENVEAHHIRLYAFVLMSNHLVLETPRANLVDFMQQLNGGYCVYFNRKHRRSGHLLGGRYKAKLVEGDEYLLKLTRYVHLNPVKIKRATSLSFEEKKKRLRRYRWSSYRGYAGLSGRTKLVDYGPLSELLGRGVRKKELAYRTFVEAGLAENDSDMKEALKRSSKAVGLESFCRCAEDLYHRLAEKQGQPLDVAMRQMETPPAPRQVLAVVASAFPTEKDGLQKRRDVSEASVLAMKLLKEEAGLTQRQVAEQLGLSDGSGISRHLSVLNAALAKHPKLRRTYEGLREEISHNH